MRLSVRQNACTRLSKANVPAVSFASRLVLSIASACNQTMTGRASQARGSRFARRSQGSAMRLDASVSSAAGKRVMRAQTIEAPPSENERLPRLLRAPKNAVARRVHAGSNTFGGAAPDCHGEAHAAKVGER